MRILIIWALVALILAACVSSAPDGSSTISNEYLARLDEIGEVTDIDWNPDGTHIVMGGDHLYIYGIDSNNLAQIDWTGGGPVTDVAWQPTGNMIVATNSPDVDVWDSETRTVQIRLENHVQYRIFNTASWSPSGDMLAVSSQGSPPRGMVRIWDTSDFHVTHTIAPDSSPDDHAGYSAIAFSAEGDFVAFSNISKNIIEVWSTTAWQKVLELEGHEAPITALSWHDQKSWLASGDRNGSVIVWDASTGQEIDSYDVSSTLTALDWRTSENMLALSSSSGVLTWNLHDNTTRKLLSESANDVSWSHDGNLLAVALLDGVIVLDMTRKEP